MNIEQLRASKILIIDDAEANLRLLEELLTKEGFEQVISTTDPTKTQTRPKPWTWSVPSSLTSFCST
jgi:CheY-like chemotaxis protein